MFGEFKKWYVHVVWVERKWYNHDSNANIMSMFLEFKCHGSCLFFLNWKRNRLTFFNLKLSLCFCVLNKTSNKMMILSISLVRNMMSMLFEFKKHIMSMFWFRKCVHVFVISINVFVLFHSKTTSRLKFTGLRNQ